MFLTPMWLAKRMATACPCCGTGRTTNGWPNPDRWVGATYCSNACKQRAYRHRVTASADPETAAVTLDEAAAA